MSDIILSPNMNLPVPVVGSDPGPQYAIDLNSCLSLVDSHDHTTGKGAPITPASMSINSDLAFNNNNLTAARSLRMQTQSAALALAADLGCLYVTGVDLYYNDGSGNQIQITQGGGVAGSPGSIGSLTSPASATYVALSQTFVWQSDTNTPANMDSASLILRNLSANSFACTLSPPAAMGSDYSLTLPTLPASQKFLTLDAAGNIGASWAVDNSTLEIASATTLRIVNGGVGTTQLASNSVTTAKIVNASVTNDKLNAAVTASNGGSGADSTGSGSYVDLPNLTVTLTASGSRPMLITLIPSSTTDADAAQVQGAPIGAGYVRIQRDGVTLGVWSLPSAGIGSGTTISGAPSFLYVDTPSAGSHTYKYQFRSTGSSTVTMSFWSITAVELR